jgi:3-phytase
MQAGADVVVNGHDHDYERFAPQDANGKAASNGIREFVAGTGGAHLRGFSTTRPNSEVRNSSTFGVLKLTLHASSYDWEFTPIAGQIFHDSGSAACVGAANAPTATVVPTAPTSGPSQVFAAAETAPVPHGGDAADDAAIWVDPADPGRSTIIGTDKQGGLAVYDLAGEQIQYLADGTPNNVDIRAGFPLGGQPVDLVTAGKTNNNTLGIFTVDPATRTLTSVAARTITTGSTYGSCMYHSAKSGAFYYFVNSRSGVVEQWELFDNGAGKVDARKVRTFDVGTQTEGCVADDALG